MPTKIQVVSALYTNKAKDVTILGENQYDFFYKNFHVTLFIEGQEYTFTAKQLGKGKRLKVYAVQGPQSVADKIRKGLKDIGDNK